MCVCVCVCVCVRSIFILSSSICFGYCFWLFFYDLPFSGFSSFLLFLFVVEMRAILLWFASICCILFLFVVCICVLLLLLLLLLFFIALFKNCEICPMFFH